MPNRPNAPTALSAAAKIVALHQAHDEHGKPLPDQRQARIDELRREARTTRSFIAMQAKCLGVPSLHAARPVPAQPAD